MKFALKSKPPRRRFAIIPPGHMQLTHAAQALSAKKGTTKMPKKKFRQEANGVLDLEGKLPYVIKHLQEMLNRYGPDAELDYEDEYNGDRYVTLFFYRDETDEETIRREAATLEWAKTREAQDRKDYLALKAKFEKGT